MKKPFPILFSLMVVLLLFSCSMNYPEQSVSDGSYSDLTDISSKTDSLSKALKDQDPDYTSTDVSEDGVKTVTLTDDWTDPGTGCTLISGSYDKSGAGISEKRMEYIYKDESGRNVRVQDFSSSVISAEDSETDAVTPDDKDALNLAKNIDIALFSQSEDGGYIYSGSDSADSLSMRTGEISIDAVAAFFSCADNRAEYTYDVTYTKNGIISRVRESFVKETVITAGSSVVDMTEQLRFLYGFESVQYGGTKTAYRLLNKLIIMFDLSESSSRGSGHLCILSSADSNVLLDLSLTTRATNTMEEMVITVKSIDESLGLSDFLKAGSEIYFNEYALKTRSGFSLFVSHNGEDVLVVSKQDNQQGLSGTSSVYSIEKLPFDITLVNKEGKEAVLTDGTEIIADNDGFSESYTVGEVSFSKADFISALVKSQELQTIISSLEKVNAEDLKIVSSKQSSAAVENAVDYETGEMVRMSFEEESEIEYSLPAGSMTRHFDELEKGNYNYYLFDGFLWKAERGSDQLVYAFPETYYGADNIAMHIEFDNAEDLRTEFITISGGPLKGIYSWKPL